MVKFKMILNFIDNLFMSFLGLTLIDVIGVVNLDDISVFESIDNRIKTVMAVLGLFYYVIKTVFSCITFWKDGKLKDIEIEHHREYLEKLKRENDIEQEKMFKNDTTNKEL